MRRVIVRVPASSANLGPGFDALAAALALWLEVEVEETGSFDLETELEVARGRDNLVVRAFERLHPADGFTFRMRSTIPLSGGLGSSAAACVAGLLAADRLLGGHGDVLALAAELEGHADNVAAALHGGFVVCEPGPPPRATRFDGPSGLEVIVVVPRDPVRTDAARAALPPEVPIGDAVFNTAHAALLVLGLTNGDFDLVARGLADRLHQPRREHLYPCSMQIVRDAPGFGALGATISGAGPTVLVWCRSERLPAVLDELRREADGWADVLSVPFEPRGAVVADA